MNHLDLFSGIGGFSLAASWVWGEEHHIHSFVEIDPFCHKVLKKHWPDVPIHDDIRSYKHDGANIDLLTGGVPCQPASQAGKRKGTEDNRWLWPEAFRVIRETKPTWCILENVGGLITLESGMVFEHLLSEMEGLGYEVQPFIIPACAVNAPHRRDRVWIVANAFNGSDRADRREISEKDRIHKISRPSMGSGMFGGTTCHVADTESRENNRRNRGSMDTAPECGKCGDASACIGYQDVTDSKCNGCQSSSAGQDTRTTLFQTKKTERKKPEFEQITDAPKYSNQCKGWEESWLEVATRLCTLDDGLSSGLARPKGWRVNALKACGNAIVPQVVVLIMQAIKEITHA